MEKDRKQFTFYGSFFDAAMCIKKKSERCDFYDAVCQYALGGEIPPMPDAIAGMFALVKPNIDASRRKAKNGKKGGKGKQSESKQEANDKQSEPEQESDRKQERDREREGDRDRDRERMLYTPYPLTGEGSPTPKAGGKQAVFSPPSLEEVTAYCQERGRGVDPAKWYDHYSANGWKVGKVGMKDWKAAVRTWENNEYGNSTSGSVQSGYETGTDDAAWLAELAGMGL